MNWFNSIIHKQESNVTTDTSLTTTSTPALTSDQVAAMPTPIQTQAVQSHLAMAEANLIAAADNLKMFVEGEYAAAKAQFEAQWNAAKAEKTKLVEDAEAELAKAHSWLSNEIAKVKALL